MTIEYIKDQLDIKRKDIAWLEEQLILKESDEPARYAVFTASGDQWDNDLTKKEALDCISQEVEIGEGKLTYRKMTEDELSQINYLV